MEINARSWELAARTTRNVRALWVRQGRPDTYERFVEEFGDLYFEIALNQFHEAYETAGLETPDGPRYLADWDKRNHKKARRAPTVKADFGQTESNNVNKVWEFECVFCGAVTTILFARELTRAELAEHSVVHAGGGHRLRMGKARGLGTDVTDKLREAYAALQ